MAPTNPTTTRKRKQASTPKPVLVPSPADVSPKDEEIPSARPAYLLLTPLLVIALLTYWALNTTSRITPSSYTGRPSVPPPFEVRDLPGRGKGLIATRVIEPGERITSEKPFIHGIPLETTSDPAKLILDALALLPSHQQDIYYNLSYMGIPASTPLRSARHALAIFETNAVSAGSSIGLFPMMARLNHACSSAANVLFSWREAEGMLVTHAMRRVDAGQELLTHYITTRQPRAQRRSYLKQHYHFDCACSVCTLAPELSEASDRRLVQMNEAYSDLAGWGQSKISGKQAIEVVRRIWRLMEEEGYNSERGQLAADAATVAAAASDEAATRAWATIAERWYGIELGADSEQAAGMKAIASHPNTHSIWARKLTEDVGGMLL